MSSKEPGLFPEREEGKVERRKREEKPFRPPPDFRVTCTCPVGSLSYQWIDYGTVGRLYWCRVHNLVQLRQP